MSSNFQCLLLQQRDEFGWIDVGLYDTLHQVLAKIASLAGGSRFVLTFRAVDVLTDVELRTCFAAMGKVAYSQSIAERWANEQS